MVADSEVYRFLKNMVARIPCSVCHRRYRADRVEVIGHRGDIWMMAVDCAHCHTRAVIFATLSEDQQEPIVTQTELSPEEAEWFESLGPISMDEVLDAMRFLRDFNGDVDDLLGLRRLRQHLDWEV